MFRVHQRAQHTHTHTAKSCLSACLLCGCGGALTYEFREEGDKNAPPAPGGGGGGMGGEGPFMVGVVGWVDPLEPPNTAPPPSLFHCRQSYHCNDMILRDHLPASVTLA